MIGGDTRRDPAFGRVFYERRTMLAKTVKVKLEVPEGTSQESKDTAVRRAHEAAVLSLWEAGELTIREAAADLGLQYHEFLDLLTEKGIPVSRGDVNLEAINEAERKLAGKSPAG